MNVSDALIVLFAIAIAVISVERLWAVFGIGS